MHQNSLGIGGGETLESLTMKAIKMTGLGIKRDNGSGYSLSKAFPGRRFHDSVVYLVKYQGAHLDNSTVRSIRRLERC